MKRIGIVGLGAIGVGRHVYGYERCTDIAKITAVCDIDPEKLISAKDRLGLDDSCLFSDYHDMINSCLIDAVDICTPNDVHCEIAEAAALAGLDFSAEKPIGINYKETEKLYELVKKTSVKTFTCFSYRYMYRHRYMRDIIKSGRIGKIRHIYMTYLKDSGLIEGRRLEWRFDEKKAGSGVLGDLAVHMMDFVRFFGEEFDGVFAKKGITVKERQTLDGKSVAPVTTDDWCNLIGMTKSGASFDMRISRVATTWQEYAEIEVIGEDGGVVLGSYVDDNGMPYGSFVKLVGKGGKAEELEVPPEYDVIQSREFVKMLSGDEDEYISNLSHGIECQKILEAAMISAETNRYVKISEI